MYRKFPATVHPRAAPVRAEVAAFCPVAAGNMDRAIGQEEVWTRKATF
jgi:hypothetical protein